MCRYRPAGNIVMTGTGSQMSEKCSLPTISLKEIKNIIEYHQCKKVTILTEEKIFLKYISKGITNWQIFGWKHFNTIRETQFLPLGEYIMYKIVELISNSIKLCLTLISANRTPVLKLLVTIRQHPILGY